MSFMRIFWLLVGLGDLAMSYEAYGVCRDARRLGRRTKQRRDEVFYIGVASLLLMLAAVIAFSWAVKA